MTSPEKTNRDPRVAKSRTAELVPTTAPIWRLTRSRKISGVSQIPQDNLACPPDVLLPSLGRHHPLDREMTVQVPPTGGQGLRLDGQSPLDRGQQGVQPERLVDKTMTSGQPPQRFQVALRVA